MFKISNQCFVYIWWGQELSIESEIPILLAIQSLRVHYPESTVYVVDCSEKHHDWSEWKKELNLNVFRHQHKFDNRQKSPNIHLKLCSKPSTLLWFNEQIPEDNVVFLDSDTFAIAPMSFEFGSLTCTGNTGVLYYNKKEAKEALEMWNNLMDEAMDRPEYRHQMMTTCPNQTGVFEDECVFNYMSSITEFCKISNNFENLFLSFNQGEYQVLLPENNKQLKPPIRFLHIRGDNKPEIARNIKELPFSHSNASIDIPSILATLGITPTEL